MKINIALAIVAAMSVISCEQAEIVDFATDSDNLEFKAEGGSVAVKVSSQGAWIASSNVPWITVSPTNGNGSDVCRVIVDTSVVFSAEDPFREGVVTIKNSDWDERNISVRQDNFPYRLTVGKAEVNIPNFKNKDERWFEVKVNTNSDFRVEYDYEENIEEGVTGGWLEVREHNLVLDKGARPRNVTLKFGWGINSAPLERLAKVKFIPVDSEGKDLPESGFDRLDVLSIIQGEAEKIEEGTAAGDSVALLGIARSLGVEAIWDSGEKMANWDGVRLWETDDERDGRVKSAQFTMFSTDDGIPFEVKYLTAAEELIFYSNVNSFLKRGLDIGPYILELSQLKRLSISAYGLDRLPDEFSRLKNLEYLDISGNNFPEIPDVLSQENFPKLTELIMNANQSSTVYALRNAAIDVDKFAAKYGGLFNENLNSGNQGAGASESKMNGFPLRFLKWDNLKTLVLSVNYLQGELPSDEYVASLGLEEYTDQEIAATDTLWTGLAGTPKVLPNMERLSINLNRFHGEIPDWMLHHPKFDLWVPQMLVFVQEGSDWNEKKAGFSNAPANMDYYYKLDNYKNKKYSPYRKDDDK